MKYKNTSTKLLKIQLTLALIFINTKPLHATMDMEVLGNKEMTYITWDKMDTPIEEYESFKTYELERRTDHDQLSPPILYKSDEIYKIREPESNAMTQRTNIKKPANTIEETVVEAPVPQSDDDTLFYKELWVPHSHMHQKSQQDEYNPLNTYPQFIPKEEDICDGSECLTY